MKPTVDMSPTQFSRHERAVEARFIKEQLRRNDATLTEQQPERLTVDFAHITDATNFLLAKWESPPAFRAFIDVVIGIAGYRAGKSEWFMASDKELARRAARSEKWVQMQRKEFLAWQKKNNVAFLDIEDNKYLDGEKTPHKYRVHIARFAVETFLDARDSNNWQKHRFSEAMEESAKTMLDSIPEYPIHVKHKRSRSADAETTMVRELRFALTKLRRAKQTNELTGNHIELTVEMVDTIKQIRIVLEAIEKPQADSLPLPVG